MSLQPVRTRRTQSTRINLDRMRANSIEAAEQCGILTLPRICEEQDFSSFIKGLDADRLLVFCDEDAPVSNPSWHFGIVRKQTGTGAMNVSLLWAPKGALPTRREHLPPPTKIVFAYRWDPASSAPIPLPSPPSHWCRPFWVTGPDEVETGRIGPD